MDFIFPRTDEAEYFEKLSSATFIANVSRSASTDGAIESLFAYHDPLAQQAVWELKYRGNRHAAEILGECLYEYLLSFIEEHGQFENKKLILAPIPLSPKRLRERGFNQCSLILEALQRHASEGLFEIKLNLLSKVKETESQTKTASRLERQKNLKGVFKISKPERLENRTVFIIDDVTTTGATLSEAIKTVRSETGATVFGIAMTH